MNNQNNLDSNLNQYLITLLYENELEEGYINLPNEKPEIPIITCLSGYNLNEDIRENILTYLDANWIIF